jgi:hypothetical protein
MWLLLVVLAGLLPVAFLGPAAFADPRAPVSVVPAPEDQGPAFPAGIRAVADLPRRYAEQEYFVSGAVDVYRYGSPPLPGELFLRDDVETAYTTRIVVRRPVSPWRFNGTLVVEWLNSTAGFDSAPAWDMSAEYFARSGIVWVGVTVSPVSIGFLTDGCNLLSQLSQPPCGARYAALSMPEPGQAYEMVSQIVTLLRSARPENPLPWRLRRRLRRVFHVGQSQQASDVTTYANEFHFELNDGYFMQAMVISGKPPSSGSPSFGPIDLRGYPRTDLPVPVVRAQTETDLVLFAAWAGRARQVDSDTPSFRYYELAGVAHNVVHEVEVFSIDGEPVQLGDLCAQPVNSGADGPVFGSYLYNAIWRNMERQVRFGIQPPHGEPIQKEDGQIARDAFGNALGGVRLPALEVPLASYAPQNDPKPACAAPGAPPPPDCLPPGVPPIIGLACWLSGAVEPFDRETLDELYPSKLGYLLRVFFEAFELRRERFLLREDAREIVLRALQVDVGKTYPPRHGWRHARW